MLSRRPSDARKPDDYGGGMLPLSNTFGRSSRRRPPLTLLIILIPSLYLLHLTLKRIYGGSNTKAGSTYICTAGGPDGTNLGWTRLPDVLSKELEGIDSGSSGSFAAIRGGALKGGGETVPGGPDLSQWGAISAKLGASPAVDETVSSNNPGLSLSGTHKPQYAHFPLPQEKGRTSDMIDTFATFKNVDECGIRSTDLHLPFSPVCTTKQDVLAAMTYGGRAGYDTPYIPMGCDMRWYSTAQICTILSRFSRVFIIGDSLQRHVNNALYILLREDMGFGGITDWNIELFPDKGIETREDCMCQKQITKHECSDQAIWDSEWAWGNASTSMACAKDEIARITYHRLLQHPLSMEDLNSVTDPLPKEQPQKPWAFVMHHELWNDVNITETTAWLDQVMDHFKTNFPWLQHLPNFPRLYVTANAGGRNKGLGFMLSQNNQALSNFELAMMPRLDMMKVDFLGFFNMSIQSTQWDGAHTTLESNLIKAMMVLNWLEKVDLKEYEVIPQI